MQPLDPHTLFSIFEQGDEEVYKEHGVEEHLDNPFVLMGMVVRGVDNHHMMDMMYMKQFPKEYRNVRNLTKYKYYNKLYRYLTRINLDQGLDMYTIGESFETGEAYVGLDTLRVYYEKIEHYEKCAVIKLYQELLVGKVLDPINKDN